MYRDGVVSAGRAGYVVICSEMLAGHAGKRVLALLAMLALVASKLWA